MADQDINSLSIEDLKALESLINEREFMKYSNAPAPPKAPLPAPLDPRGRYLTPNAKNSSETFDQRQRRLTSSNKANEAANAQMFAKEGLLTPGVMRKNAPGGGQLNIQDTASLLGGSMGTGPGSSAIGSMLASATTRTPADLATLAAGGTAGNAMRGLQATSRGANIINRALQGYGLYEGGNQLNAGLSRTGMGGAGQPGREQPSLNPMNKNPMDLAFALLSGTLGAAQGMHEVPRPPGAKEKFAELMDRFRSNQADIAQHEQGANAYADKLGSMEILKEKVKASMRPINNALVDAQEELKASNQSLKDAKISLTPQELDSIQASDTQISELQQKIQGWKDRLASGKFNAGAQTQIKDKLAQAEKQVKVLEHKKVVDKVQEALKRKRSTEDYLDDLGVSHKQLTEQANKHGRMKPAVMPEPENPNPFGGKMDLKDMAHVFIRRGMIPAMTGTSLGYLTHHPMLGAGAGVVLDQLATTDAGQKFLDLMAKVGPNAIQTVPALTNAKANLK